MKPFLSLICLALIAAPVHAAPAAPAAETCRAKAEAAVKRTAAYRHGSVREKQALLRGQAVTAYIRVCVSKND